MAICRMRIKKSAEEPLLPLGDSFGVPLETRLQWVRLISEQILNQGELDDGHEVRD